MGTGDFGTSPIFAQLSDKQLLVSIFLAGASERKAQWRIGKSPISARMILRRCRRGGQNDSRESRRPGDECSAGGLPKGWVQVVLAGPGAGIQGQRRLVVMGFNRRKMEDQRRTAAEKEVVTRRREFLWSLASF